MLQAIQFCYSVFRQYRHVACQCIELCGSRQNVVHKAVPSQVNAKSASGGITVDLRNMRNVTIDPVQQTAVAQGVLCSVFCLTSFAVMMQLEKLCFCFSCHRVLQLSSKTTHGCASEVDTVAKPVQCCQVPQIHRHVTLSYMLKD